MATSPIIVFQAFGQTTQLPGALAEQIKKQEGFRRALFGCKVEDPGTGILCTEWSSRDAALRYATGSSPSSSTTAQEREMLALAPLSSSSSSASRGWAAALDAPCTEVFTAFGAEAGFVGNVGRFVDAVAAAPPEGYRGAAFGERVVLADGGDGDGEDGGRVVRMVIGWTSREAHLEAKERPGAIQHHIHELRSLRRAVDLFHVALKEL